MPRYKITLEYDGHRFFGWQRQRNQISVQEAIETAIKNMFGEEVLVEGAGRTDAGVHALGQVAHFDLSQDVENYRISDGLNHFLRDSGAVILQAELVPNDFHARFSATKRTYEYRILNRRSPLAIEKNHVWHVIPPLDIPKMKAAAAHLVGHHDFTSFRSAHCQAASAVRTIDKFEIVHNPTATGDYLIATIQSRSFLHNQVRIMMGTLKLIGEGRFEVEDIPKFLEGRDRRISGPTAPPQGLYLKEIAY